jgi:cell division septation protein DedD
MEDFDEIKFDEIKEVEDLGDGQGAGFKEKEDVYYFCKLTFGQFFTFIVLQVITLVAAFYIGAKYGAEYLNLGSASNESKNKSEIVVSAGGGAGGAAAMGAVQPPSSSQKDISVMTDDEIRELARKALASKEEILKERVSEILSRGTGGSSGETQAPTSQGGSTPILESATSRVGVTQSLPTTQGNTMSASNAVPQVTSGTSQGAATLQIPQQTLGSQALDSQVLGSQALSSQGSATPAGNASQRYNVTLEKSGGSNTPSLPNEGVEAAPAQAAGQGTLQAPASQGAGGGGFTIQVGAYPDIKEASYRVEEWKAMGYPAFMQPVNLGDRGTWYRVRIGNFATKEEASKFLSELSSKEGIDDAFVTNNE